ncbi:MAG: type II secretion system protein GspM [Desulfobacterales bacterium]|jgi:general secretion pathway protein M
MTLLTKFNKLNKRERYAIIAAIGVVGIFLIAQLIIGPFLSRTEQKQNMLRAKAGIVEQMRQMQAEYESLTQKANISESRFRNRQGGFTLFSFLDRLAGETGIKDRISYMKPSKKIDKNSPYKISSVEMKLEAITLEQLTNYLYGVETSENMVDVQKISISKKDIKEGLITAVLQVETVEL